MESAWWVIGLAFGSFLAVCAMVEWRQMMQKYMAVSRMGRLDQADEAVAELWWKTALGFAGFGVWCACVGVVAGVAWVCLGR